MASGVHKSIPNSGTPVTWRVKPDARNRKRAFQNGVNAVSLTPNR
jgi:hypothetical protein